MTDPVPCGSADEDEREPLEGANADFGFGRSRGGRQRGVDPVAGRIVGDVRLEHLIAEGGMGRVYLGRQLRPDRLVAVKVIRPGMFSAGSLKRFERESQVLASLHHPGIAQIHSFGTFSAADAETPYFVMEFIAGAKTITDFADERGLNTRERLELFQKACDAVSHAHSRGILHRDLKPGNILVAEDGQPKIIDFGVARQLDRDTILTTAHEDINRLIGTIQYMAPEQFRGDSRELDVRVDVYALGVILYELLTGRPPFDLRRAALAEAARVVLDEEPQSLSSRDRAISRDIGLVAQKCLQKNPQHRYASAHDLARDIGRYLQGEPVLARAPSPIDRLARVYRRHRVLFAFLAGTLSVLLALAMRSFVGEGQHDGPSVA
ncbi:MAG: serine/threonine-protein kinase, partial [Planctomycetia bacterium]|nr:serine/threonine-protein kinase [Planctomycetia bacterium]